MLHQKTVSHKRYYADKELRIKQAMDTLSIDQIGDAVFATIPSTSGKSTSYTVDIDESGKVPVATNCDCVGHKDFGKECVHILAVNAFYARIYARPEINLCLFVKDFDEQKDLVAVASVSEVVADADTQVRINEQQAKRDAVSNPYEVLAPTKQISREAYVAMFDPCRLG